MVAEDGSNGAWCGDTVTFIAYSLCKSAEQKAGKLETQKGS